MQKLSICCALLINPRMIMFDGHDADPKAIKELKSIFIELKSGCAVLISTHIIDSIDECGIRYSS